MLVGWFVIGDLYSFILLTMIGTNGKDGKRVGMSWGEGEVDV